MADIMADINTAVLANTFKAFKCPTCGYVFIQASRCPECGQKVETVEERNARMKDRVAMVRAMETVSSYIYDKTKTGKCSRDLFNRFMTVEE